MTGETVTRQATPQSKDVIYATALLAALDFCPACGWKRPTCVHMAALRRIIDHERQIHEGFHAAGAYDAHR